MIVNDISTLDPGIRGTFQEAYDNGEDPADILPFVTQVDSTKKEEDYAWLGAPPALREFIDSRVIKSISDYKYTIENKKYEGTLGIARETIEDDQLGAIGQRARELAFRSRVLLRKLFFERLITGETGLGYDSVAFFSAAHTSSQSNLIATGAGTTLTQLKADIDKAETMMANLKDDQGEPYNEGDIRIGVVCPPALRGKFRELNRLGTINNTDNVMQGRIEQITSSARLTDANDWYLFDISNGVKPFIHQIRVRPQFDSLEAGDESFDRDIWKYGVRQREAVGFGLWQKAVKIKNT